jgi:lambda family phage portal protein
MGAIYNHYKHVREWEGKALVPYSPKPVKHARLRRNYDAAAYDRLTASFLAPNTTGDAELRSALPVLRARSRELERNNDYAKKFLHMVETNVVGKTGFTLRSRARDKSGELDKKDNRTIETEWREWCKRGNCTVDGLLSFLRVQKLVIRSIARDGEVLVRLIRGFKNPWRFAIQILEGDYLNEGLNDNTQGKNRIRLGIEYDSWGKPVAYWIRKQHPGDVISLGSGFNEYERVPVSDIIHVFWTERPTQGRGIPWMRTAARRMNVAGEYEYAELIAARIGASKMGFYIPNEEGGADIVGDDEDEVGNPITEAEPGIFEKLPSGYKDFKAFLPEHPVTGYGAFMKEVKRGMASGLNVAYNSIANDLEGVNFSSMRSGALEERDSWTDIQNDFIDDFLQIVRAAWLEMLLLTNRTTLPYSKYDKFNQAEFNGRTWDWVDPEKDINAALSAVDGSLSTLTRECAARGLDYEDILEERASEIKLAEYYKVPVNLSGSAIKPGPKEPAKAAQENGAGGVGGKDNGEKEE